jgi:hypothetical protein
VSRVIFTKQLISTSIITRLVTMKHAPTLILAAGLVAAQTSTVTVLLPEVDQQTIFASVISVGPTATSYFIACPSGENDVDCGLGPGMNLLYGPSVVTFSASYGDESVSPPIRSSYHPKHPNC